MNKQEYFAEIISETLEELGKYDLFTKSDVATLAKNVTESYENIGLAFYTPPPGDITSYEVKELKKRIKDLEKERDAAILSFKQNVSLRRGWPVSEIVVGENGHAEWR